MNLQIRLEDRNDFKETESLIRESFWDLYKPGCDEHFIIHKLRMLPAFVSNLDFVATIDNKIVGNIIYSRAKVINDNDVEHEVLCMGPLSVLPSYQKKGIGSTLINYSIKKAIEMGFKGIIIFGNPDYYTRFGYKNALIYNIKTSDGINFDAFMALELYENSLKGIEGKFYFDPVFIVAAQELEEFEKEFPYKEKHITDTQLK
ncbi:MAG TPA: N-acetyltransferase [Spirochaetota bacterium]